MAASVSTRVVSWKDAAEMNESVESDAFVIPSSMALPCAGRPPSRLDKLGVKAGLAVRLQGEFDAGFTRELKAAGAAAPGKLADLILLAASRTADLARIPGLAAKLQPAGGLWVIYPKGVETIREIDVIEAGRAAGLKDTKVVSFSSTHTGLRFTVPLAAR